MFATDPTNLLVDCPIPGITPPLAVLRRTLCHAVLLCRRSANHYSLDHHRNVQQRRDGHGWSVEARHAGRSSAAMRFSHTQELHIHKSTRTAYASRHRHDCWRWSVHNDHWSAHAPIIIWIKISSIKNWKGKLLLEILKKSLLLLETIFNINQNIVETIIRAVVRWIDNL